MSCKPLKLRCFQITVNEELIKTGDRVRGWLRPVYRLVHIDGAGSERSEKDINRCNTGKPAT